MNSIRKLFVFVIFLCQGISLAGQQSNWDVALDRYELICERCLELKRNQDSGMILEKESITSLRTQLTMLRNNLLEVQGQMSNAQKARFDMIRQRFESRFSAKPNLQKKTTSKVIAPLQEKKKQKVDFNVPSDSISQIIRTGIDTLSIIHANAIGTKVILSSPPTRLIIPAPYHKYMPPKHEIRYLIGLQGTIYPLKSFGMMLGVLTETKGTISLGGYAKCLSDFKFKEITPSYFCKSDGTTPDGKKVWTYGETASRRFSAAAGVLMSVGRYCGFNLGVGYGSSRHYIKDISGNWAQIADKSATGFTVEIGALFFPGKHFWANIGISTTAFRYLEPQLAFGFSF